MFNSFFICFPVFLYVKYALSVNPWNVSATEFNRLRWQSSIVVDDWLYIDGGEFWLVGANSSNDIQLPPTLSIDLSTSWETSSVVVNQIAKPSNNSNGASLGREGLFLQDATNSVVVFGGDPYDESAQSGVNNTFSVWQITVANGDGKWSSLYNFTDPIWQSITWPYGAAYANSQTGGGWSIGGYMGSDPTTSFTDVLNYTMVNTTTMTLSTSTLGSTLPTNDGIAEGGAQFVPRFGSGEGIVVVVGGIGYETQVLRDMSDIIVFDPATQQWYSQTATGDIPHGRRHFCITGAEDTNTGTFEIFVFGGHGTEYFRTSLNDTEQNADSTNVYILTLPAFRWIRSPAVTTARALSTCHTLHNQMLSVGGYNPTGLDTQWDAVDPFPYGIGVFHLTALEWLTNYNATASPYVQSSLVQDFYSENPTYPVWDNSSIAALFNITASTVGSQTPTPVGTTGGGVPETHTPVGAIVGGVVGGLAVALGLLILSIFVYRCRLSRKKETAACDSEPTKYAGVYQDHPALYETGPIHEIDGTERPAEMTA